MSILTWVGGGLAAVAASVIGLWIWKRRSAIYHLQTRVLIEASADVVYDVLTDYEKIPSWSSFIMAIEGDKRAPGKLKTKLVLPRNGGTFHFTPTLLIAERGKEFRWRGSFLGLYVGEHYFQLRPTGAHSCELLQGEDFWGILVPFLNPPDMGAKQGFADFNLAIKKRAETLDRPSSLSRA